MHSKKVSNLTNSGKRGHFGINKLITIVNWSEDSSNFKKLYNSSITKVYKKKMTKNRASMQLAI